MISIENLELALSAKLPRVYKEFLKNLGSLERAALAGSNFEAHHLLDNNEGLIELFKENNLEFELPDRYLCFLMHQGYIAFWIALNANEEDPVVWNFSEGTTEKPRELEKLSEFIPKIINEWGGT